MNPYKTKTDNHQFVKRITCFELFYSLQKFCKKFFKSKESTSVWETDRSAINTDPSNSITAIES